MKENKLELLKNQFCKIVVKEPGENKANVFRGTITNIDYESGFIFIESDNGIGIVRINTIIAIKPRKTQDNKKRNIVNNQTALIGIGTLIVFIAMILVAAVAATVIIQTSNELENRAQSVGKQTIAEVSSGLRILDLTGKTDVNKTVVEYLAISVRPRAGSQGIDLNETLVYLELEQLRVLSLDYNNVESSVNSSGVFNTINLSDLNATNFGMIAIRDSDNSISNNFGLASNDLVMIIINLSATFPDTNGVPPGADIKGRIVPEIGAEGSFSLNAPSAFPHRILEL